MPSTTEDKANDEKQRSSDSEKSESRPAQEQERSEDQRSQGHGQYKDKEKHIAPANKARFILIGTLVGVILVVASIPWLLHASTYEKQMMLR